MPDTQTANYNLIKPEVGASTDTWGTKLNANMDTIDATMKGLSTDKLAASRVWTGTQADYNAITTKVATTLYFITP